MENGSSKFRRPTKSYHKIYGSKENDSEIDFEEEPRTALMASKTTKKPIKSDDNYLLPKQLKRKRRVLRLEQKEIEMIKSHWKNKENVKLQQMN
jgi:hypothetical protein